jgi:hypothetical protein
MAATSDTTHADGLSGYVAERESELARLAEAVVEGELIIVCAAEPSLAAALAQAAARQIQQDGWGLVHADIRLADDETDLARTLARAAASTLGDLSALTIEESNETPQQGRTRLAVRRVLGARGYALAAGTADAPRGAAALTAALEAVAALRADRDGRMLLLLLGVDELVKPGRSRFAEGFSALWAMRGVWQRAHGPALLTGGRLAAAMSADPGQALYGYGVLHEVHDLPHDRQITALGELLGDRLEADALDRARTLIGHAPWLAPQLQIHLPVTARVTAPDLMRAWRQMTAVRLAEHHALLRASSRIHRLAVPVLKALSRGKGPYAELRRQGRSASDISRALLALEHSDLVHRTADHRWRVADPTFAAMLAA